MHFWQVVTRVEGGVTSPVKYFFIGAIPEFIKRRDLSLLGTSEKLPRRKCPFDSKNDRYFSLNVFNDIHSIAIHPLLKEIYILNNYIIVSIFCQ